MEHDTAGDPITGLKWTRKTTEKIACELKRQGILVCANTVGKLLNKLDFSLKVNHKKNEMNSKLDPKDRDQQFKYIAKTREYFMKNNHSV
ncbi:MAG: ISAzo13 family transposase, partial [Desulfobacula sp.]|nr:ISAzo13 family transposase [Desulfobacula sp.]